MNLPVYLDCGAAAKKHKSFLIVVSVGTDQTELDSATTSFPVIVTCRRPGSGICVAGMVYDALTDSGRSGRRWFRAFVFLVLAVGAVLWVSSQNASAHPSMQTLSLAPQHSALAVSSQDVDGGASFVPTGAEHRGVAAGGVDVRV